MFAYQTEINLRPEDLDHADHVWRARYVMRTTIQFDSNPGSPLARARQKGQIRTCELVDLRPQDT